MATFWLKDQFGNKVEITADDEYSPDVYDDLARRTLDLYQGMLHTQITEGYVNLAVTSEPIPDKE